MEEIGLSKYLIRDPREWAVDCRSQAETDIEVEAKCRWLARPASSRRVVIRPWKPAAIGGHIVVRLCDQNAVVLAAVQDAARRLRRCPAGILDRRCARQRGRAQVGTAGWPS